LKNEGFDKSSLTLLFQRRGFAANCFVAITAS
jgi:hypothetical protein